MATVTLKLKDVLDLQFQGALMAMLDKELKAKTAYRLSKIYKTVQAEQEEFNKLRIDVLKKYCVLDEKGEIEADEKGNAKFESDEKKAEYLEEIEAVQDEEIEVPTVEIAQIDIQLSPKMLLFLDKILM